MCLRHRVRRFRAGYRAIVRANLAAGGICRRAGSAVSTPSRAEGPARRDAGPALRAEEVGFEPTVPCRTTVFETVRFGRSRTPPSAKVVDASCSDSRSWQLADAATAKRRKEGAELPRCLLLQHATGRGDLEAHPRIGEEVVARTA